MKQIRRIMGKPPRHWVGDGFHVYPVFNDLAFSEELSPFLMFDYASPEYFPPTTKQLGVGTHPHRGFETVTIAFQGAVDHEDSTGGKDTIYPGDVQWMTAGRGIIHQEFHNREFATKGGTFEMCQLWVNLPAKDKMTKPQYQPITSKEIVQTSLRSVGRTDSENSDICDENEGFVRIIAGSYFDVKGPAKTFTPVDLLDITVNDVTKEYIYKAVTGYNVIIFVRKGKISVQGKELGSQDVALMKKEGTKTIFKALEKGSQILILAGEPLNEPIAARGPFVMNTQKELQQAIIDYQSGKFGR